MPAPGHRALLRVASYNIRKAVGLDWRRDPDRIVDVLSEIGADIVVLQEADRRMGTRAGVLPLDRLEEELGYTLAGLTGRALSHGWHGNAILLRAAFAHYRTAQLDLPTIEPRGAVSIRLAEPEFEVVGVHLGLTPGMRRRQMAALEAHLRASGHPVLLAGDFNEWNAAKLRFAPPVKVVSPGPSFHAARPSAALDRFVLGPGLRPLKSYVHHSQLAARASDHLPVVLDLEIAA